MSIHRVIDHSARVSVSALCSEYSCKPLYGQIASRCYCLRLVTMAITSALACSYVRQLWNTN